MATGATSATEESRRQDTEPSLRIPRESMLLAASMIMFVAATNILTPLIPVVREDVGGSEGRKVTFRSADASTIIRKL